MILTNLFSLNPPQKKVRHLTIIATNDNDEGEGEASVSTSTVDVPKALTLTLALDEVMAVADYRLKILLYILEYEITNVGLLD